MKKFVPFLLGALIVYAAIRSLLAAATKPLGYDEIFTWTVVRQPSFSGVWKALSDGADASPPLFYLLERIAIAIVPSDPLSLRLLSILGFCCTVACLFFWVRNRNSSSTALLCASIPLATVLFATAIEGRPYSIWVACYSIALVSYQHAPALRWMLVMGLSLAIAQGVHYYAVLSLFPFILAEATWTAMHHRVRSAVWLTLGCGALPLVAYWPLLSQINRIYGANFWAKPSVIEAGLSYSRLLAVSPFWGVGLAAIAGLAVLPAMFAALREANKKPALKRESVHEYVLVLGLLALPLVGYLTAWLINSPMATKYVMPALLGFPLAAGLTLPRWEQRSAALLLGFTIAIVVVVTRQESEFWSSYTGHLVSPTQEFEDFLESAGYQDLPILVSEPHDFLQLFHYASPHLAGRIVSLVDPAEAVRFSGSDSADKNLLKLQPYGHLPVHEFAGFADEHPVFLLYSSGGGRGLDWWPERLSQSGYKLELLATDASLRRVLLVTRTPRRTDGG